jgi:putative transposase
MPFGLIRYHKSKQAHFITISCFHRKPRFNSPTVRDIFLTSLEQTRVTYALLIYGYVVMPNHVHLIVSEPERGALSIAMQALKVPVAKCARTRAPDILEVEPFWQKRYYDHNIRNYEKFVEKLKYIHRNPVKRELVQRPEDWPWSSFLHYATGERGVVEIESDWTARGRAPLLSPP